MTATLFDRLTMPRGPALPNRFALAPLTNQQSFEDGRVSEAEIRWLTMRAAGGFGLTMTAAAYVQRNGRGFPGQIGIADDMHLEGLARMAAGIRAHGSVSSVQLYHAGPRAVGEAGHEKVNVSDDPASGARAMTLSEVEQVQADFIAGAQRAERAGFAGVELHGAHGYLLCQFLSPGLNRRTDRYGGSAQNRARLVLDIIDGIRGSCGPDFQIGLRLSTERFGLRLGESRDLVAELLRQGRIDYLDLSLWDVGKEPEEDAYRGQTLMSLFTSLPRGAVRMTAAGKVMTAATARSVIEGGCDFVMIGRAAILRHDFPDRVRRDAGFASPATPISIAHLEAEGVTPPFIAYLDSFQNFVAKAPA